MEMIKIICSKQEKEQLDPLIRFAMFCVTGTDCIFEKEIANFDVGKIKWFVEDNNE